MARTRQRPLQNPNLQGVLVLGAVLAISVIFIWNNQQPEQIIAPPVIEPTATRYSSNWQIPVQEELASLPSATPLPPELTPFVAPTLLPTQATVEIILPNEVPGISPTAPEIAENIILTTPSPSPGFLEATPIPIPTQFSVDPGALPLEGTQYQLPPEQVPLSRGPNDHFLLVRPVDISANSQYLYYYPYGSGGQGWRIHRGLDMGNVVGTPVIATGSGKVVWACSSDCEYSQADLGDLEIYQSYGNFVVIEHDFGWRGQRIWTLYAHMSAIAVEEGQLVEPGNVIGLVGVSGDVTGPHVHYEVRVGTNSYSDTRNPLLWMAPYLNHGVIAGQVLDGSGDLIETALVQINNENGRRIDQTTTYVEPCDGTRRVCQVVPDNHWQENFVLGDIPEGNYELVVLVNNQRYTKNITVSAGTVTFEHIQIDVVATPQVFVTPTRNPNLPPPTSIPTAIP